MICPSSARTIPSSSAAARLEVVVDDAVVEVALRGQLLLGDLQPRVDRLGGVGAARLEALAQDRRVGRRDEDLDRLAASPPAPGWAPWTSISSTTEWPASSRRSTSERSVP